MSDSTPYLIPEIPYLRLRCTLRAEEEALLPSFKGSMLRGAFGHALRKAVCALGPRQVCESCGLRRVCLYTRLFETFIEDEPPPFFKGQRAAPRPFVIEAHDERRAFSPGDRLGFDLLLFGSAVELQTLAGVAVAAMAERGLGERKRRFTVETVAAVTPESGAQTLYSAERPLWDRQAAAALPPTNGLPPDALTLHLRTPLRLKAGDHLLHEIGFRGLAFRALARVLSLAYFFGDRSAIDWSFQRLLRQADRVRITAQSLSWRDLKRYSARQGTEMSMGGVVGTLQLAGDLAPFAALLRTAEIVHIGKGATFGLGQLAVEPVEPKNP
jgi:hypothetical protein